MKKKWNLAVLLCMASWLLGPLGPQLSIAQDTAPPPGVTKVMTLPGRVDAIDLSAMTITLDGKTFDLAKDVEISSRERTFTAEEVSVGLYVIATIKTTTVVALAVVPDGQTE